VTWSMNNLLNNDNSLVISAHEESSMGVPTLNMILSSSKFIIKSNKCECLGFYALTIRFRQSKHVMIRGMTNFKAN